jgi:hypothetical protein
MKMAPESLPLGERLRLQKWSAMNSKLLKWMVSPRTNPMLIRWLLLVTMVGFGE